jgi:hypothetical protein
MMLWILENNIRGSTHPTTHIVGLDQSNSEIEAHLLRDKAHAMIGRKGG